MTMDVLFLSNLIGFLSRSPELLIFNLSRQCSNMLKVRWEILHRFHLKFIRLSAVKEF